MEGIAPRSATTEQRTSKEHFGTRVAAGALVVLGGLGLAGCASAEAHGSAPTATASAEATSSAEAAPLNDMTTAEFSDWATECVPDTQLAAEMDKLTQANIDYFRKAFANQKDLGLGNQDVCNDLVDDLGTLLVKDRQNK